MSENTPKEPRRPEARRGGLGRGLAALIPTGPEDNPSLGNSAADVILGPRGDSPAGPRNTPPRRKSGRTDRERAATDSAAGDKARTKELFQSDVSRETTDEVSRETELVDPGAVYREIAVADIRPNPKQPRTVFDEEALEELTHSVREFGLLQPIVVREIDSGYELIMGERRWRASQRGGLETIPAIVRQTEDQALLRDALLENIHRVQLNPLEEAAAYQQLLDEFGVTQGQLAERIGRSRPAITNSIRLLQLGTAVQRRVAAGVLSAGHARALLGLESGPEAQDRLAARIVAEGLSVRATEEIVTLANRSDSEADSSPSAPKPSRARNPEYDRIASRLSDRFETKVTVTMGKRKGRIAIDVGDEEDLERIISLLESPSR